MADTTVSGIEKFEVFERFQEFKKRNPSSTEGFSEYSKRLYWFRGGKYYLKHDPDKGDGSPLISGFVGEGSVCL